MSVSETLFVDVVETEEGFDQLRSEWDRLFLRGGRSVFQSFEWQRAWWRHFGEGCVDRRLHLAVVRSAGDDIVGFAPCFIQRVKAFGVVAVQRLAFLGRCISDYLDVVAADEQRVAVAQAFARHIVDNAATFDVCVLEDMSARSSTANALRDELSSLGVQSALFTNARCPRAPLKHRWEDTLASLKAEHRRDIKLRRRTFEKRCAFELEIAGGATAIDADIEHVLALHRERSTTTARTRTLDADTVERFHREVARDLAARGWTFLAFLRVRGRRIAVLYGFCFNNELAVYLAGAHNAGELRQLSPGRVLTSLVMEHAVGCSLSAVDFMRGSEPYKYELGGVDVDNRTLVVPGARSRFSADKHRATLVSESLSCRVAEERGLWSQATAGARALSVRSAMHLQDRIGVLYRDGLATLRQGPQGDVGSVRNGSVFSPAPATSR